MNAVIYARYSSDNQREESITAQLRICRAYCQRKGYTIVHEYCDEAFTATNDNRPAYQQMFNDAKYGNFNVAVFHKVNRNARNEYDYYFNKMKLLKWGVSIEYAGQAFDLDTPEGQLMENQLVGMAAYFSRNLAKEVKKGQRENALSCIHNGGQPPLGYDVGTDKHYIINQDEAPIVRMIYQMYASGCSYGAIQSACNEHGYLTKRGKPFGKNSLYEILRNRKYIGVYIYGKTSGGKMMPRNSHKKADDAIEIEGGVPIIIDRDMFDKVQERMDGKRQKAGRNHAKENYLLSGLVYCGSCGYAMVGNRRAYRGYAYSYYTCSRTSNTGQRCHPASVQKKVLEEIVIRYLRGILSSNRKINAIVNTINEKIREEKKTHSAELLTIKKEERAINTKIENLLRLAESGTINDIVAERLEENKMRRDALSHRRLEIESMDKLPLDPKQVKLIMKSWRNVDDQDGLRVMIDTFVKRVIIYPQKVTIEMYLNMNGKNYDVEMQEV